RVRQIETKALAKVHRRRGVLEEFRDDASGEGKRRLPILHADENPNGRTPRTPCRQTNVASEPQRVAEPDDRESASRAAEKTSKKRELRESTSLVDDRGASHRRRESSKKPDGCSSRVTAGKDRRPRRSGAEVACRAHNPEVARSNRAS